MREVAIVGAGMIKFGKYPEKGIKDLVRESVESTDSSSSFLPIATEGSEERLAKETFDSVMVPEKHEIKHYLKAIHRALKDNA